MPSRRQVVEVGDRGGHGRWLSRRRGNLRQRVGEKRRRVDVLRAGVARRTDAGGGVVLTSAERARDLKNHPILVLGMGEALDHNLI